MMQLLSSTPVLDSLGWTILHSLWQLSLITALLYGHRRLSKGYSARQRYRAAYASLLLAFLIAVLTFNWHYQILQTAPTELAQHKAALQEGSMSTFTEFITTAPHYYLHQSAPSNTEHSSVSWLAWLSRQTLWISCLWAFGFLLCSIRYVTALRFTRRLRAEGLQDPPAMWQEQFRQLLRQIGISSSTQLKESSKVQTPLTLGFFKPIVLVPIGFFNQLPPEQVEAILLHELAHIQRHDYLFNLIQIAIKTLFFYHPGIRYISNCIDAEREYACDDLTVHRTQNPKALIKALGTINIHSFYHQNQFAMKAINDRPLLQRLKRLLPSSTPPTLSEYRNTPLVMMLCTSVVVLLLIGSLMPQRPLQKEALKPLLHPVMDTIPHNEKPASNLEKEIKREVELEKNLELEKELELKRKLELEERFELEQELELKKREMDLEGQETELEEREAELQEHLLELKEQEKEQLLELKEQEKEHLLELRELEIEQELELREMEIELAQLEIEERKMNQLEAEEMEKKEFDHGVGDLRELKKYLIQYLIKDGLIDNDFKRIEILIPGDQIIVNDKTLEQALYNKYNELFLHYKIEYGPNRRIDITRELISVSELEDNYFEGSFYGKLDVDNNTRKAQQKAKVEARAARVKAKKKVLAKRKAQKKAQIKAAKKKHKEGRLAGKSKALRDKEKRQRTIKKMEAQGYYLDYDLGDLNEFKEELTRMLLADNLIKNADDAVIMQLSGKQFVVNEQAIPLDQMGRYQALLERNKITPRENKVIGMNLERVIVGVGYMKEDGGLLGNWHLKWDH
ncbi:MAG: M56 family metallopeptidase [Bacteroidota bacterium]